MKEYTHPPYSFTLIRQKDGSSYSKQWVYNRANLILEGDQKIWDSVHITKIYKIFFLNTDLKQSEFIKDKDMKEFYMEKIETLLQNYEPGDPSNKPDVLKQMIEIDEERKKLMQQNNGQGQIMLNQDGKEIALTNQQIVQIIQSQQEQLQKFERLLVEKDSLIKHLLSELHNSKN